MDNHIFAFHKTVIGYGHIQEEIPCEDASVSYASDDGNFQIIVVGDGHGDPACHRSAQGSKLVIAAAVQCLREFAQAICAGTVDISAPEQQEYYMKLLTHAIISQWYGAVRRNLLEHEMGEDDFREAGRYEKAYRQGSYLEHLYGTTLIAALQVGSYLILIQQGDGRCDVFYQDGSVDQPVPWDDRCKGTTTTSMCDRDVLESIRYAVLDVEKRGIVACYIGSDGVEDSYYENEKTQLGTHRFYMALTDKLYELGPERFDGYLEKFLPEFSKSGSRDDVSVAGIVSLELDAAFIENYKKAVRQYDDHERLCKRKEQLEQKLISMTRKHGILEKKLADAEASLKEAKERLEVSDAALTRVIMEREKISALADDAKNELENYERESKAVMDGMGENYHFITAAIQLFMDEISNVFSQKKCAYAGMLEKIAEYDANIKKLKQTICEQKERIASLSETTDSIRSDFEMYDAQYRGIDAELKETKEKLDNAFSAQ